MVVILLRARLKILVKFVTLNKLNAHIFLSDSLRRQFIIINDQYRTKIDNSLYLSKSVRLVYYLTRTMHNHTG